MNNKYIENHFITKNYLHFDKRLHFKNIETYVSNPQKIALHSFLPFLKYELSFTKFRDVSEIPDATSETQPQKKKTRKIMYAGHLDGYIYKYYSLILNEEYNSWAQSNGIDNCSLAYRTNKPKQSNIDFAAKVINTLVDYKQAYILIGDFTNFFDKIDHSILKESLIEVIRNSKLDSNGKLTKDWYNIYRSVTKHGYYEKSFINEVLGSDKDFRLANKTRYFNTLSDFRDFQKEHRTQKNQQQYGIPQGTAISGVFANIYAINFDMALQKIAANHNGFYQRYSDDFILLIPQKSANGVLVSSDSFKSIIDNVMNITKKNSIDLEKSKTNYYKFSNNEIIHFDSGKKSHLDYLGFIFDGNNVNMRGKSPYKFYRKAYQLIDIAQNKKINDGLNTLPYKRQIYSLYTDLGTHNSYSPYGNFISYAKRAQKKFDEISPKTNNLILNQIKNRKKKIEKKLKMRLHTKV